LVGLGAAFAASERYFTLGLIAVATAIAFLFAGDLATFLKKRLQSSKVENTLIPLLQNDLVPTFLCSQNGAVKWHNSSATTLCKEKGAHGGTLNTILDAFLPNAAGIYRRMSFVVNRDGASRENLVGLAGRIDLYAHCVGEDQVWRIDPRPDDPQAEQHDTPMLTIGRKGAILFMNSAAKSLIGERVVSIDRLFLSEAPASGKVQVLKTKNDLRRVRVETQHVQADRYHLFLSPMTEFENGANFPLKDLPIPLLRLSMSGEIEQANDAALTLLGYSHLEGRALNTVFEGHGILIADWIAKATGTVAPTDAEFLRVRGAKRETFVQVALKRIGDQSEPNLIAILTDATKLKSLEAQFVQSQKMQAIGQLAGGVAHDFNNLLTAISGHCDLMLLRHDPGDQDYADLMQVHQNANRAAGLVSQLLAFSRKQTLKPEQLDLRNTLSDLTHSVLRPVRADKRQLEQVIMNLVVNARDAMPEGGEITIQTESMALMTPLKRDRVTVPSGDYIVVRVSDVGIGIDEESLEKIFEPFYTTKRTGEGTGLGLSTAYGEDMQEKVEAVPEIKLPMPEASCSGAVLLVEDEAPVRAFASRALKMRGFDVIEAESGEKALEILADTDLHFDVFVTDVVMPGMDGPTWVEQAIKTRPKVKTIFVSGYAEGAFQGKCPQVTSSVFLAKPFSLLELTSTVQNQMSP